MGFSIERSADISTVQIVDQLEAADRPELRRAVLGDLADGTRIIRIDFARATYVDGAGLGLLVSIARLAREHGTELRLANLDEDMETLFMLTKLDTLFTIEREGDSAAAPRPAPVQPRSAAPMGGTTEDRPRP
jgi:anti-sigma B factor antagonist